MGFLFEERKGIRSKMVILLELMEKKSYVTCVMFYKSLIKELVFHTNKSFSRKDSKLE
jgi:hypothetical protein